MTRRCVLLAGVMALLPGDGLVARHQDAPTQVLTAVGHVSMVSSLDGLTIAVLVDIDGPGHAPDGLIERAFRLQHKTPSCWPTTGWQP